MKIKYQCTLWVFLIVITFPFAVMAQQNLVPNPSFEDTLYCPPGYNRLEAAQFWLNFGQTPDYWNSCAPGVAGIPNLSAGYQHAHSGNAMAGLILYRKPTSPSGPNYREYFGCELLQPLVIGNMYYVTFYINFSYSLNIALACNNAGLRFSTVPYDGCCSPPLTNWAHLYSDSIFSDSVQWAKISGSFIADSNYTYLVIGNFFDDQLTDTIHLGLVPDNSYYYIDDVCVSSDSIYANTWTGIYDQVPEEDFVQVHYGQNSIIINTRSEIVDFNLYNSAGQLVNANAKMSDRQIEINQSSLSNGIYFIRVRMKDKTVSHRILISQ